MFIIKAQPGGRIDQHELLSYPEGHLYCVQANGWMDDQRWDFYLAELLPYVYRNLYSILIMNVEITLAQTQSSLRTISLRTPLKRGA